VARIVADDEGDLLAAVELFDTLGARGHRGEQHCSECQHTPHRARHRAATDRSTPSGSAKWCRQSGQLRRKRASLASPSGPPPTGNGASRGLSPAALTRSALNASTLSTAKPM